MVRKWRPPSIKTASDELMGLLGGYANEKPRQAETGRGLDFGWSDELSASSAACDAERQQGEGGEEKGGGLGESGGFDHLGQVLKSRH